LAEVLNNNQLRTIKTLRKMKALVDQIKAEYEVFVANADAQVEKGNKAAGARARKAALNLMKAMKEFRKVSVEAAK
jgi:septum formation inhibitor-activating ATPase MinD